MVPALASTATRTPLSPDASTNVPLPGSVLQRVRRLWPYFRDARTGIVFAALATVVGALTEPMIPALLKALLDGYTDLVKAMHDEQEALDRKRAALRTLDRRVDQLNKRWYKVMKNTFDPGSDAYEALSGITTEPSTPAPDPIEINTLAQGGDEGRQVLVSYLPGGGDHATSKLVKWQVVGVDADFVNSAPLDASGNALGPFAVGTVVRVITEVSNSSGTRTTAPRTITIEEPIE